MTYDQLVDAIVAYFGQAGDPDPNFVAYLPVMVEAAEGRIYTGLRHPRMVDSAAVSTLSVTGFPPYLVPDRMLEPHRMTGAEEWEYVHAEEFFKGVENGCTTKRWTIFGNEIVLSEDPPDTLVFSWYAKPPPLSEGDAAPLFQLYPQLFLYGALIEAATYLREPAPVIAAIETTFLQFLSDVRREAWSAGIPHKQPLTVRTR